MFAQIFPRREMLATQMALVAAVRTLSAVGRWVTLYLVCLFKVTFSKVLSEPVGGREFSITNVTKVADGQLRHSGRADLGR